MEAFNGGTDAFSSLGKTLKYSFVQLVEDEEEHELHLRLYDTAGKKSGKVVVKTKFIHVDPGQELNPVMNRNCNLKMRILNLTTVKGAGTLGKRAPFVKFRYDD